MAAEESPPTHRARSRMQVRVARVTAMAQKRHGLFSGMMRPRRLYRQAHPLGVSPAER